jgi:hypothetical protein
MSEKDKPIGLCDCPICGSRMCWVNLHHEDWGEYFCDKCNKFHTELVRPKDEPIVIETKVVEDHWYSNVNGFEVPWLVGTRVRVTIERVSG